MSEQPIHDVDEYGNEIHIDVDPFIPTGICGICSWEPPFIPEWEVPSAPVLPPTPEPDTEPEETPEPDTLP